ncbi:MAG: hypothetical protein HYT68_01735 [Candidatus Zambryskibacteria bacterium]|nr:hypothetical protein [Candidatus Zambryskibacteria bacterium]
MSLSEIVSYDKDGQVERFPLFRKLFLSLVIILVALLSFGIGRLSVVGNREPVRIEYDPEISNSQFPISNQASIINALTNIENSTSVVVSKNGARYHYPHCAGAKQIKEENKIVFSSPAAAEAAGYTLAANCSPR